MQIILVKRTWNRYYSFITNIVGILCIYEFDIENPV